jgi:hypothetical protein
MEGAEPPLALIHRRFGGVIEPFGCAVGVGDGRAPDAGGLYQAGVAQPSLVEGWRPSQAGRGPVLAGRLDQGAASALVAFGPDAYLPGDGLGGGSPDRRYLHCHLHHVSRGILQGIWVSLGFHHGLLPLVTGFASRLSELLGVCLATGNLVAPGCRRA